MMSAQVIDSFRRRIVRIPFAALLSKGIVAARSQGDAPVIRTLAAVKVFRLETQSVAEGIPQRRASGEARAGSEYVFNRGYSSRCALSVGRRGTGGVKERIAPGRVIHEGLGNVEIAR